jgi:membrane-bound ClpP family serine protease
LILKKADPVSPSSLRDGTGPFTVFRLKTLLFLLVGIFIAYEILEHGILPLWGLLTRRKKTALYGPERLLGATAEVREWRQGEGLVLAGGEIWRAVCAIPLKTGDRVKIEKITGLTLTVSLVRK